jgi:hypothetical protein
MPPRNQPAFDPRRGDARARGRNVAKGIRYDPGAQGDPRAVTDVNEAGQVIRPIESALKPASNEQLHEWAERAEKQSDKPVPMESLTPISQPDMTIQPGTMPGAPRTVRTIPKPFQRPRIDIEHHGKSWQNASASQVQEGDLVVDHGRIAEVIPHIVREEVNGVPDVAVADRIALINPLGEALICDPADRLRVFRPAGPVPEE